MKISVRPIVRMEPSSSITFRGKPGEFKSKEIIISAGIDRPLKISHKKDNLRDGRIKYRIETIEEGRKYKIHFENNPDIPGNKRGYLLLNTNYKEKPELRINIRSYFQQK